MKLKKLGICIALLVNTMLPIKAKVNNTLIIASKQLPYIMYVEVSDEKHMKVQFISRDVAIPTTCKLQEAIPLKKIDLKTDFACVQQSVESFYNLHANRYVYVHLNRIAEDLNLPYKGIDFKKLNNITNYFENVVKHLKLSTILKYGDYIESDLGLTDYYDYYDMFKGKKVEISYTFTNQVYVGSFALPLDNKFHKLK
ncbi:hypothetical protein ACWG0P_11490 [Amedibacillus sp. YH-ame6]